MSQPPIEIRKYPNRRYYNTRDSRHVTLEEIRDLVREGHDIKVIDSRSDEDITVAVMTQILLEIESPKLAFFPATFLQHLIRVNTDVFKSMTESYFKNSLASFVKSAEAAGGSGTAGFGLPLGAGLEEWQKMWTGMFGATESATPAGRKSPKTSPVPDAAAEDRIAELSRQVEEMQRTLRELQSRRKK